MKLSPCLQLLMLLAILQNSQCMPIRKLSNEEYNIMLDLIGKSNNIYTNNNEYYEAFTLNPIIVKMDSNDDFKGGQTLPKSKNEDKDTSLTKDRKEKNLWTSITSFFTNDLQEFAKDVVSVVDNVKRSETWVNVETFFNNAYEKLIKTSENVLDDLKKPFSEE